MHARVYVNHGRWVVDCPRVGCGWAYRAMTTDGRPRYQTRCAGGPDMFQGRTWHPGCEIQIELLWPELDAALEIERLLCPRPAEARNWRPPETIHSLALENDLHLVGWTLERLADAGIGVVA